MAYYIVETLEQLNSLRKADKCYIEVVTLSEHSHPALTTPSLLYYNDFEKGYLLPISHSEGFSLGLEDVQQYLSNIPTVYLLNKKRHLYYLDLPQAIDVGFTILEKEGEVKNVDHYTTLHLDYYSRYAHRSDVNTLIPLSKHYERCQALFNRTKEFAGKETGIEWLDRYVEIYKWIEEGGMGIDVRMFDKHFEPQWRERSIRDTTIYTEYNLYNTTSRPTNAFNGVNFLALPKDGRSRASFVPKNDVLIEFDFDGYHLRLLGNLLGVELPGDTSIHALLGKEYFGSKELTEEEYEEAKKLTFRQLYNGVDTRYKHIPLLHHIDSFAQMLGREYEEHGYITLANGRRAVVERPTPQKLLNYFTQSLETVNNVKKLCSLKELLKGKKSRPVLVVYDSILVDYSAEDGVELLRDLKNILEDENLRVRGKKGYNYNF